MAMPTTRNARAVRTAAKRLPAELEAAGARVHAVSCTLVIEFWGEVPLPPEFGP